MSESLGSRGKVIRLSWESGKALPGNEKNARETQVLCFQPVKNFLKIRVFAAVGL